jgi:hypothetical protein
MNDNANNVHDTIVVVVVALVFSAPFIIFCLYMLWSWVLRWRVHRLWYRLRYRKDREKPIRGLDGPKPPRRHRRFRPDREQVRNVAIAIVVIVVIVLMAVRSKPLPDECTSEPQTFGPDIVHCP